MNPFEHPEVRDSIEVVLQAWWDSIEYPYSWIDVCTVDAARIFTMMEDRFGRDPGDGSRFVTGYSIQILPRDRVRIEVGDGENESSFTIERTAAT